MTTVSDNFARPNGVLGGFWGPVIPNNAESGPDTFAGGVLINNNGYGPINAFGGDACALWKGGQSFGNNQWASATIKTVAGYTAQLSITAATQSGGNTTYTYTVSSGSVTTPISGGALYVIVSGMQNAGNNGHFLATTFGSGTFTVANASGVTESGSSGTGLCPSDSGGGVVVRGSGNTAATLNGYFFHVGTNSFNGNQDGRVAYHELWKVVNGVGTILGFGALGTTLPAPGDVLTLIVNGTTLTALYNGTQLYQLTDASIASGVPGLWAWSMNGPNEYQWGNWATSNTAPGNNGTTLTTFLAGDGQSNFTQLSSDALTEGTTLTQVASDNFTRANGAIGSNWASSIGSLVINGNLCEASSGTSGANVRNAAYWSGGQTFNNNQYSEVTISALTGTALGGPVVRASGTGIKGTTGETGYICLVPKTGTSGSVIVQRIINGTGSASILTISSITPNVGDVFRITASGTTISVSQNGSLIGSVTDTNISSGLPGIFVFPNGNGQGSCAFSLWAGGGVGVPSKFSVQANQNFASDATLGAYCTVLDAATSNGYSGLYENTTNWPADQYCQATLSAASSGAGASGPAVRVSPTQDTAYWFAAVNPPLNTAEILKNVNGTVSIIASVPYVFNSGDVFRLEVQGNVLIAKINGTIVAVITDSSIASGRAGITALTSVGSPSGSTNHTFNNWSAGSAVVPKPASGSGDFKFDYGFG